MALSADTDKTIKLAVAAWKRVKAEELARNPDSPNTCILSTGAGHDVLQREFDLALQPNGADLWRIEVGQDDAVAVVLHPDGDESPIKDDGYHGHVVLVLTEGERSYLVDLDLGLYGPLNNGFAQLSDTDGDDQYLYRCVSSTDFLDTPAWKDHQDAAARLSTAMALLKAEQEVG